MAYINGKETFFSPVQVSEFDIKLQASKTVDITKNGTVEIVVDKDYDGMVKAVVNVDVAAEIPDGYINPSGVLAITENGAYSVTEYEGVNVNVPTESGGGGSFKGEYNSDISYSKGDVVTYSGDVYQFDDDYSFDNRPMEYMPWTKLNTNSGGGSSGGLVTLPAGTYYPKDAPYYSNNNILSYRFDITEAVSGSYCLPDPSNYSSNKTGTFSKMGFSGNNGTDDAPYIYAKFDEESYAMLYGEMPTHYIVINSDTQVSSLFYDAFMGAVV